MGQVAFCAILIYSKRDSDCMLKRYRRDVGLSFLIILAFYIIVRMYKVFEPMVFPRLESRILYVLVPVGLLALLMWFPSGWIRGRIREAKERKAKRQNIRSVRLERVARRVDRKESARRPKRHPSGKAFWGRAFAAIKRACLLAGKIIESMQKRFPQIPAKQADFEWKKKKGLYIALLLVLAALAADIVLAQMEVYSVEWALAGFVIAGVVCFSLRIDSRFMIFPAILLLGYCPFLLMGGIKGFAENIAVYAYYFLVIGVGLQFAEYFSKRESSLDFGRVMMGLLGGEHFAFPNMVIGAVAIAVWFFGGGLFGVYARYSALYFFALVSVLDLASVVYRLDRD